MNPRDHALALLDALGVGTEADQIARHRRQAAALRACFRGQYDRAVALVDALEGDHVDGVEPSKIARYPLSELAWIWADTPAKGDRPGPGELDARAPAFAPFFGWWRAAEKRAAQSLAQAEDDGDDERAATLRRRIAAGVRPRGILVLSSDTGAGKTVTAIYAAARKGGRFLRAADLGEIALGKGEAPLAQLAAVPLLVIDELGRENTIGATPTRVTELLALRDEHGLATLITTQLPARPEIARQGEVGGASFRDRYGHHILDRVEHGGGCFARLGAGSLRDGVLPRLDGIRLSCRISDYADAVEEMTARGQNPKGNAAAQLQRLTGVSDRAIAEAHDHRRKWSNGVLLEAEALRSVGGDLIAGLVMTDG